MSFFFTNFGGRKYGRVERLYIDVENRQVFIRFTDQVSALRVSHLPSHLARYPGDAVVLTERQAVNELDGRIFNGNTVVPKFFDTEKFERGIYR